MKTIVLSLLITSFSLATISAQILTTLVKFNGTNGDGACTIIQGQNGNFYGTTLDTIFEMTPKGSLTVLTNNFFLLSFNGFSGAGNLILGSDGNFYGVSDYEGTNQPDMIFKMSTEGVFTVLTNLIVTNGFASTTGNPVGLTEGMDGNFYVTMRYGFNPDSAWPFGALFKMTPEGVLTTLVNLETTNNDGTTNIGIFPNAALVQANDGNFYGTTIYGGDGSLASGAGVGTIFKMTPNGTLTTLVILDETNGAVPYGSLVQANDGNLYGTCGEGGLYNKGTVFRMTTNGVLATLDNFDGTNGAYPACTLIQASDGDLYGTTTEGGDPGDGTVFKMTPDGALTTLVNFKATNGADSYGSLVQASDGDIYGTASEGGDLSLNGGYGYGTIFKITGLNLLPRFQSITMSNGTVRLAWNSVSNWTYRVQYKTNLADANWTDLPGDILATNAISSKADAAVPAQRFYRLVLLR
ncbi:MAG: choice-of-anchor tandem repeat GloVer-containing protein [Limisphaerales bacterium]